MANALPLAIMSPSIKKPRPSVRQAANVLELLEYFAQKQSPATLSEIADSNGWPRSSTFNLIGTLIDRGYLYEPRSRGGYYPSPRWLALAHGIASAEPLSDEILSLARDIASATGETTTIGGSAGTHIVFLHVVEAPAAIRYFAAPGNRRPIHATAIGRAILAQYGRDERQSLYRRIDFVKHARNTLTSIAEVEAELDRSRVRGWFRSESDYSPDLCGAAVSLPVRGRRLSLMVAGPEFRCLDRLSEIAEIIRQCVARHGQHLR